MCNYSSTIPPTTMAIGHWPNAARQEVFERYARRKCGERINGACAPAERRTFRRGAARPSVAVARLCRVRELLAGRRRSLKIVESFLSRMIATCLLNYRYRPKRSESDQNGTETDRNETRNRQNRIINRHLNIVAVNGPMAGGCSWFPDELCSWTQSRGHQQLTGIVTEVKNQWWWPPNRKYLIFPCIKAYIFIVSYLLLAAGRHIWFTIHTDVEQF